MYCTKYIENLNNYFNKLSLWYYFIPYIMHIISSCLLFSKSSMFCKDYPPLYDIIISNTPDLSKYHYIPNILMFFISVFLLIPLFFKNYKLFISFFKYFSIIVLLRTITTQVTVLPPQTECKYEKNFFNIFYMCLNGHYIDKIFSGHTSASLLIVLLYFRYNILDKNLLYLLLGLQILLAFSLILTRSHYTIDILIAYIITFGIFLLLDL